MSLGSHGDGPGLPPIPLLFGILLALAVSVGLVSARVDLYLHPLITAAVIFVAVLADSVRNTYLAKLSRRHIRIEE